jgi:Transglutaminase-like superfamily
MILLKNLRNASTGLSTNGKSPIISTAPPFVPSINSGQTLRSSKDERSVFHQENRIISFARDPILFLAKALLALDLVLWLCWLPVILRVHTIPLLLNRLSRSEKHIRRMPMGSWDVVGIVTRICNLRPFRSRFFPKVCLRQSLTLYRTLSQMGYPVEIHFGTLKDGEDFYGHSWVTIHGEPLADTARSGVFRVLYSYPYNPLSSGWDRD